MWWLCCITLCRSHSNLRYSISDSDSSNHWRIYSWLTSRVIYVHEIKQEHIPISISDAMQYLVFLMFLCSLMHFVVSSSFHLPSAHFIFICKYVLMLWCYIHFHFHSFPVCYFSYQASWIRLKSIHSWMKRFCIEP